MGRSRTAPARRIPWRPLIGVAVAGVAIAVVAVLTRFPGSEVGFDLPTLDGDEAAATFESAGARTIPLAGALAVEANGCFTWRAADGTASDAEGAWIVWPDGFRQDDDRVVTDTGERVGDGDALEATGAVVALDDLPDSSPDGYFGSFGGFCGADERGVLVLTAAAAG